MNQSTPSKKKKKLSILDLPTHITTEILSRLPVKTLLHCQVVCKHWLSLTSDSHFAQLHLSKSPIALLIKPDSSRRHLCLIDPLLQILNPKHAQLKLIPGHNYPLRGSKIVNSCNGLLCLCFYDGIHPSFFVCNPILGEYISLPISRPGGCYGDNTTSVSSAFGFSPKSKKYKVVHFYLKWASFGSSKSYKVEAEIYTLGEGPWRNLGTVPFFLDNDSFYASLNGAFHWLTFPDSPDFIRCFDFDSEQPRVVHEPPDFGIHTKYLRDLNLGVLRDSLSICDFSYQFCVEIWMMQDYGIKDSWTKEFVIENGSFFRGQLNKCEPVMILESGEILMLVNRKSLVQCNPKFGSLKNLNIYGFKSEFDAVGHIPSFVSLLDAAKGERLTLLSASTGRKRKSAGSSHATTSAAIGEKI